MVLVLFANDTKFNSVSLTERLLADLPSGIKQLVLSLRQPERQLQRLLGYTLLREILLTWQLPEELLESLYISQYGKPFLKGALHFNISHWAPWLCVLPP